MGNTTVVSTITGGSNSPSDTSKVTPISTTSGNNNQENDTSKVVVTPPSTITDPNLIAHLDTLNNQNNFNSSPPHSDSISNSQTGAVPYGTWVEKFPSQFDGIRDTITFDYDLNVKNHFYFKDWKYKVKNQSIVFYSQITERSFEYKIINNKEIQINNFIDRSLTLEIKNIIFTKTN